MIRTGKTLYATSRPITPVRSRGRNSPWQVFGVEGQQAISAVIRVASGESVRVSAFGLCDGCISVDRVVLGVVEPFSLKCCQQRGGMLKPPEVVPPVEHRRAAVDDCGDPLMLSPERPELTLPGPGVYQLMFSDGDCHEGVYVEAQRISECCERS